MNKKCLMCNKLLNKNKRFCSETCRWNYHYNRKLINHRCKICGQEFLGKKNESCCSKKCFIESHKTEMKKCLICNKKFNGSFKSKYCSKKCYRLANSKKKGLESRTCIVCNKSFQVLKLKDQIVCSDICEANLFSVLIKRLYSEIQKELK